MTPARQPPVLAAHERSVTAALAIAAAFGAGLASASPTGLGPSDAVFRAGIAGLVTVAGARARRWTSLVLAAIAFAVAHHWLLLPAAGALLLSFVVTTRPVRPRVAGALVAAVSVQILFRQHGYGFHGASSLLGAVAVLIVLASAHSRSRIPARRRQVAIVVGVSGVTLVVTMAFAVALVLARQDLETGGSRARDALAAVRAGDSRTAEQDLGDAADALRRSASLTGSWWAAPARVVPLLGQQAAAISLITKEGRSVVRSARVTAAAGDYTRLKYRTGRFDVARLRDLRRPIADSAATLDRANHRLATLDRSWLIGPLRSRIDEFGRDIGRATPETDMASSLVEAAPGLLGADGTRHYFVAFITPAELRGAGGFIGNYGELTAENGKLRLTRSGVTENLRDAAPPGKRQLRGLKDYLRRYGAYKPADFFQDLTFSPHFPFDAQAIEQLYPQSGGQHVDGVISIDPFALAALLQFTGPVTVPGLDTPLTSANAADILLRQQYTRAGTERARKDLLVEASRITFEKLTTGDLPTPQTLARVLGPMVSQRRIMLHSTRPAEQRLFAGLHADGALPASNGRDVLSIASDNAGNNKIDTFLHRDLAYDATIDPATGRVEATATVTLRNDAPPSGLPDIVIGNASDVAPGTNLMTLSLYSALDLVGATLDGQPVALEADREAGLHVYSVRLSISSHTTQIVRVHLAGGLDLRSGYQLIASPQPMANADRIEVSVHAGPGWRLTPGRGAQRAANGPKWAWRDMRTRLAFTITFHRR